MNGFGAAMQTAMRLKILELLAQANGYSLNNEILRNALSAVGIRATGDQLRAELGWLEQVTAVKLFDVGHLIVAELTERGHDVAHGNSVVRGIDRPVPGSGL